MAALELLSALFFYLPFLLTIVFGFFALAIGIVAIFSGTVLVLLLAAYGSYAVFRDSGLLLFSLGQLKRMWTFLSQDIERNLQRTFVLKRLEMVPKRTALYLCHPHGLFGYSWLLHFCYGISEWPSDVPKPVLAIHSILFRIPFVRDVLEQCHCIEAKETVIQESLRNGTSVAIVTGGIEEMVFNGDEKVKLVLKKRRGYARVAKACGVPIVPLFTRGEHELFPTEPFWLWKRVSTMLRNWTGIEVPLPSWSSMKRWATILQGPLDTPIETFVLGVIDTEKKDEVAIRKACETLYTQFFQTMNISAEIIA
jgi:hypothetical protein